MNSETTRTAITPRGIRRALRASATALVAALAVVPFLGAGTAFATGTSVTSVSGPAANPATTSATSVYTVGFTTSSSGALAGGTGTITLSFPGPQAASPQTGTVFPSSANAYTVDGTVVSASPTVSNSSTVGTASTVTITVPASIAASTAVTVVVNGVTNPSTPGTYTTATVATSADTVPAVIPSYTLTAPPGQVTLGVCCSISASTGLPAAGNPSPDYAGSAATYAFTFTTSAVVTSPPATGALAAASGTITVAAPTGTVFPSSASDYVVNGVAASTVSGGGTDTATITTPVAIPADGSVDVVVSGVTNPAATASGSTDSLTISTSSDTQTETFGSGETYTIAAAPTAVTKVVCCSTATSSGVTTATAGNPTPNGTGVTTATYGIGFTTSASGALSSSSSPVGSITVEAPAGTVFPAAASDYSVSQATASSVACENSAGTSVTCGTSTASTAVVSISQSIAASTAVNLIVSNVTNPTTSSVDDTVTVFTSSDLMPVTSGNYTIYSSVSNQTVNITSQIAGASTVYQVAFETSSTGALAAGSGSISIDAPSGTVFPTSTGDYTISQGSLYGTPTAAPIATAVTGGGSNEVTIVTPAAIGNSTDVVVTINDVTNPAASTGSGDQLSVSTSSDKATATTSYYPIVAAPSNEVSGVSFSPSSSLAAAQGVTYTVKFTTSSQFATGNTTYNLVGGSSTITITATAGTALGSSGATVTVNGITVPSGDLSGLGTDDLVITSPANVTPNGQVTVVIGGSTNPSAGNYVGTVVTSTDDTAVVDSSYYVIGTPTTSVSFDQLSQEPNDYAGFTPGQYDFTFTTSSTGGLTAGNGTITITSTATTIFPSTAALYVVNGVEASTVSVDPSTCSTPCAIITTPVTINADAPVTVNVNDTTNPAVATSDYTAGVSTSADPAPAAVTPFNTVTTPTAVSSLDLAINPASASQSAKYTFSFTTSSATASGSTYNLVSDTSTVTVVVPSGTTLPSAVTDYTVGGVAAYSVSLISSPTPTCTSGDCAVVTVGTNISPSTPTSLVITGATNPTSGTTYTASLFTSTDADPVTTSEYSIGTSVGSVALPSGSSSFPYITTDPSPQLAGGSPAEYAVSFDTSSTGALVAGTGTITITGPAGMTMPSAASDYTVNGMAAAKVSATSNSAVITIPVSVGDSAPVIVVISGATNPPASTSNELMVSTSADTVPAASPTFATGSEISKLTGPSPTPATEAAINAVYTLDFVTSSTGALSTTSSPVGAVTIDAPPGTTMPSTASDYVFNSTAANVTPSLSATNGSLTDNEATVDIPVSVAAGGSVALTISGVTNPPSGNYTLSVNTSSDTAPVATTSYTIGSTVTGPDTTTCATGVSSCPSVTVSPAVGTESASYTVDFTTSASGALVAGTGTIVLAGPTGTVFPSAASDYVVTPSGGAGAAATTVTGGGTATVTITTPVAIVDSTAVTLSIASVTNPPAGTDTMQVSTSADLIAATSGTYTLSAPPAPVVTSISPTVGSTAGGTTVTITGSGFSSGATVDFGTVAGTSVNVVSSTSITVVSPAQVTGTVNVTVTVNSLTSGIVSGDQFTYEAAYTALTPTRICDTRSAASIGGTGDVTSGVTGQCANSGTQLTSSSPLDVTVAGIGGVPTSGVSAVVLNVTAANEATGGFVTVYPAGASQPSTSNLNFKAGDAVANLVEVGVGTNGQVAISADTSTDIIVDVEGYYSVPSAPGEGLYNGLSAPARICDTRSGNPSNLTGADAQCTGKTLGPNTPLSVQVTGNGGIPSSGVTAVVLNLTAVGYSSGGYLTAYPGNITTPPLVSNVNFHMGEGAVPNRVIVPVSSSGTINLVSDVTTDALVDVDGYFTAASSSATGAQFNAEPAPVRILDTRCAASPAPSYCSSEAIPTANASIGTVGSGKTITVTVAGLANVPKTATAVVLNVTATNTSTGGYLTVYPGTGTPPTASDLNWTMGATTANLVIATLSSTGTVTIYNFSGTTDVIADVMGWYQ